MPRIYVEFAGMKNIGNDCKTVASRVESINTDLQRTIAQLDWDIQYKDDIGVTARRIVRKLEGYTYALKRYQQFMDDAYDKYVRLDEEKMRDIKGAFSFAYAGAKEMIIIPGCPAPTWKDLWKDWFWEEYGWGGLLAGSGYIGTIYDLIKDIKNGTTWADFGKSGIKIRKFAKEAAKTYKNYKKIGNAVGTKRATAWWLKNITGLKPLGRASTAKNPFTRFANNLTNKTSPFNAQFKEIVKNFKGANGVGKAVASWAAVAVNGITNLLGNIEEQKKSNGTMSNVRVAGETVMETAVDTVLTYGTGIVVGAAVTAALGTVAAPGIFVTAVSGAIVAGANVGIKALTGKRATEWISDTILDIGEAKARAVGKFARNVSQSIGSWFGKLSFA